MGYQSSFGSVSDAYDKARLGYPREVFDFCIGDEKVSAALDLGCGTGISTRQLKKYLSSESVITGADISIAMLEKARTHDDITYIEAAAQQLPFEANQFDIVTAFGSFHWFADESSIQEIARVLRSGGIFAVVNKDNVFARDIRAILREEFSIEPPYAKKDYLPAELLSEYGFERVEERENSIEEFFTIEEAMALYDSMSFSKQIPESQTASVRGRIEKYFSDLSKNNVVGGSVRITAVKGYIP